MNWPNRITLCRIGLSFALFALLASMGSAPELKSQGAFIAALALFALASLSDGLDGWLARRNGQVTVLGRILDPFADKVLTSGSFVLLAAYWPDKVPPIYAVVVLTREYAVSAIRNAVEARGIPFGAAGPGKLKMILQSAFLSAVFMELVWSVPGLASLRWVLGILALVSTLHSGFWYAHHAHGLLRAPQAMRP